MVEKFPAIVKSFSRRQFLMSAFALLVTILLILFVIILAVHQISGAFVLPKKTEPEFSNVSANASVPYFHIHILSIAENISVYIPDAVCRPENCPAGFGTCNVATNQCIFNASSGWVGLQTLPEAYATQYCSLSPDGCLGVTHVKTPYETAKKIGGNLNMSLCSESSNQPCVGIVASPPIMMGNSQEAIDPSTGLVVRNWGLGLTEASGICYSLTGPDGGAHQVVVAMTDRCGGYCSCDGMTSKSECGPCVNKNSLTPGCPCVGNVGNVFSTCCGLAEYGCPAPVVASCDWCASNNHAHFDVDVDTFNWLCGSKLNQGSCRLTASQPFQCMTPVTWPPSASTGSSSCGTQAFACSSSPFPEQPDIPTCPGCCCNWGKQPAAGAACACA